MNYYVDPSSIQIIELGTRAFPFKNMGLAFVEILNYHSHSTNIVSVFLKEGVTHNALVNSTFIINMTEVIVESYTNSKIHTPAYAYISLRNSGVVMMNSKRTAFNILKHNNLRLDSIIKTSEISELEYRNSKLESSNINIVIIFEAVFFSNRASLTLNRLNVTSNYDSPSDEFEFHRVVYGANKIQKWTNMYIEPQGQVFLNKFIIVGIGWL